MNHFAKIKDALLYIDEHLDEKITFQSLAERFHFSPYYFHRMFSVIVGKTIALHIRDRRLMHACIQLVSTDAPILHIGMESGYESAQSFSRAFKSQYGISPSEYRRQRFEPVVITVDDLIMKFTNRLKGGIYLNPNIIQRKEMLIAGVSGDGFQTGEVWDRFEKMNAEIPVPGRISESGYEVRLYEDGESTVHVGYLVSADAVDTAYTVLRLPESQYASFEVYVANGYDSENSAMNEWLATNTEGYSERLLGEAHYCVEYYDERFNGNESGSIVEIWVPIEKTSK